MNTKTNSQPSGSAEAHAYQQQVTNRIHQKVLSMRGDGSAVVFYQDPYGMNLRAREATSHDLETMEAGVVVARPAKDKAVRKRRRRARPRGPSPCLTRPTGMDRVARHEDQ
jgi:hypothetical protein